MKQGLLFEEEKKEEELFKEESEEIPQSVSITHPELVIDFVNQCKNRQEQFDYTHVDTNPHDKKGKEPYLITRSYTNSTKDTPSGMTYQASSYELFLTDELDDKKHKREQPFAKDVPYLRQISIQSYRFFITARARKTLENMFTMMNIEFDFDKFIKEYNMMSENHAKDELIRLCVEKHRIKQEITKLNIYTYDSGYEGRYGTLHYIRDAIKLKFGIKDGIFKPNKDNVPMEIMQLTPNELYKSKEETIEKLIMLNNELIAVEKQIEPDEPERCYGVSNINDRDWS